MNVRLVISRFPSAMIPDAPTTPLTHAVILKTTTIPSTAILTMTTA